MRIFFQNPTKGPLITVSFDAGDGASLAFVPAAMDCGAKVATTAGVAGGVSVTGLVTLAALIPGDSSTKPLPGINRFAPRASIDVIEDGRTIERAMQSADAVGLPGEGTPTTAVDDSPLAGLAATLKSWDGVTPFEIAGFKFEKGKITISTDNVQDIIDTARVIQEAFRDDARPIVTEFTHPNLRRNMLKWAHQYFGDALSQFKTGRDRILALSHKLEQGGKLFKEDREFLEELTQCVHALYGHRDAFGRDLDTIKFLTLKTTNQETLKLWDGFTHDMNRRTHTILNADVVTRRLLSGRPLNQNYIEMLNSVANATFEYIIRSAITLANTEIKLQKVDAVMFERDLLFKIALAHDEHIDAFIDILANLISNAARYSDPQKEKREIHITVQRTADGIEIEVLDNGIGIPEDKLKDIGQFGFRVGEKPVDGSHGRGLWQVQKNLEDLGWSKLQVESTHGDGSAFRFTIPNPDIQQ